ncbi:MAG TPA: amidohydrolase [Planctomycetota bacterium]|nr:amidohydrolase [Planctomycetota bacterium]
MPTALELAKAIQPELIDIRRDFHRHPEVAWEEVRTGGKAADYCERLGLSVKRNAAKTGVIAELNPGKTTIIGLRADMDALPIREENEVEYKSTRDGKGHLCGHDAHTAMLMGAARILSRFKDEIPFTVRFIFQPAEEVPPGGAEKLIEEGHLDGVNEILGLHVNPLIPVGCIGLRTGPFMASMDKIEIEIEGVGGHGAMPHLSRDPVLAAAEMISSLQSIVSRRVDPLDSAVVSICQMEAGSAFNVIPARAKLIGTARSLSAETRNNLPKWVDEICQGVAQAHGQKVKLNYVRGTPVLVNEKNSTEKMGRAFRALGGIETEIKPTMGGEDFAFYLEKIPGCFGFLGAGDGSAETSQCFHHPRYNIDEKALAWGSALFVQMIWDRAGLRS